MSFCTKKCYATRAIARKSRKLTGRYLRVKLTIYWCEKCDAFHLTSMDPVRSRELNRPTLADYLQPGKTVVLQRRLASPQEGHYQNRLYQTA